jgi:hypothetical protein
MNTLSWTRWLRRLNAILLHPACLQQSALAVAPGAALQLYSQAVPYRWAAIAICTLYHGGKISQDCA